jgi:hypothetical protein
VLDVALDGVDARYVKFGIGTLAAHGLGGRLRCTPIAAIASRACASISNQMRNLVSGDQIAVISGLE